MKLSSISNSEIRFGNIYTIRGTTKYHISPFEQKALAGIFKKGIPNTFMRFRASVMYWLPCSIIGYLVYAKANAEHERLQRKQPGQFDHET